MNKLLNRVTSISNYGYGMFNHPFDEKYKISVLYRQSLEHGLDYPVTILNSMISSELNEMESDT